MERIELECEDRGPIHLHLHQGLEIFFVLSGVGKQYYINREYSFSEGDVFLCSPLIPHIAGSPAPGNCETGYFLFSQEIFTFVNPLDPYFSIFYDSFAEREPIIPGSSREGQSIMAIIRELLEEKGSNPLLDKANLLRILAHVHNYYYGDGEVDAAPVRPEIQRVLLHIQKHYRQKISVEELTNLAGLSRSRFESVFSLTMGMGPTAYVNGIRIFAAKKMMLQGYTIGESLSLSGFNSPACFTKVFRQYQGMTPREWLRKNTRASSGPAL